jgi:UDP-N-acetylglucosamine--N-acetylmuramyl-(pentapeptide) pyrophosphoryl-undecaprenol N-acetylglucosamine transferase
VVAPSKKPLLFITGGSQGSQFLNSLVLDSLPLLLPHYQVCVQTGQSLLTPPNPDHLIHRPHLTSKEMAYMLQNSHIIISRAGANTISECMALGVIAICIPLPHSRAREQQLNAAYLSKLGQSLVLPQNQATPTTLLSSIHQIETNYSRYQTRAKTTAATYPQDAVFHIYQLAARLCA